MTTQQQNNNIVHFVHEGTEVKLTGRTASKSVKSLSADPIKILTLHEVTPVDSFSGDWKKWVRLADLYEVTESNK